MADFENVIRRRSPEILAPAGNLTTLQAAVDFGADAVYCGGQAFSMRSRAKNLSLEEIAQGVAYAHAREARVFVTCNILPKNSEITDLNNYMGQLADIGVDALIVSDIGVLMSARKIAPKLELHVSTQAGITNYQAGAAFVELGASRIVLARELDLQAIKEIRARLPKQVEIEAFVHGSMCMAFSGRCLISQHTTGRDANHGDCAQSCRWKYHVVEEKRPGQFFPIEIHNEGTFLFNSQDMNLLEHVDDILDAGVTSLKIEGRAKGAYYVAAMANAYKCVVNQYLDQRAANPDASLKLPKWLLEEPFKVTHREYCSGFYYQEKPASESIESGGYINDWRWIGVVTKYDNDLERLYIHSKNKIVPGDSVEFLFPNHPPVSYQIPIQGLADEKGRPVTEINRPAHEFSLPCPQPVPPGAMIRMAIRPAFSLKPVAANV